MKGVVATVCASILMLGRFLTASGIRADTPAGADEDLQ